MTYREKLKMEHPECVDETHRNFIGGCHGCPKKYGYGPEDYFNCGHSFDEKKCTACWNKVIPGTDDKLTFKIPTNLDEMMEYFEAHGFNAFRSYSAHTDTYQFTINKGNRCMVDLSFKHPQGKNEFERAVVMLDYCERLIVRFNDDVLETKQSCIDDLSKAVDRRDKEIEKLEREREHLCSECQARDKTIEELDRKLRKSEATCNAYKLQATQKTGCTCCCKADLIAEKDKEIKALTSKLEIEQSYVGYFRSECRRLAERMSEQDSTIYRLEKDLEAERKEHSKHHGFFARFNWD